MELKLRKRINNRLPGFVDGLEIDYNPAGLGFSSGSISPVSGSTNPGWDTKNMKPLSEVKGGRDMKASSAAGIGPWFALGEWAGSGIGEGINKIQRTSDILQDAGTSEGSINGISYQRVNDIDQSQRRKDYDREMGMSFLTNPFKGLTMLFGRRKQRNRIREAAKQQALMNTANMAGASSEYLQLEYAKQYGNDDDLILYAKNGKDAVHTSEGEYNIIPNSKVEDGEIVYNRDRGTAHVIPGSTKGDKNYASILPSDTIISNKYGLSDKAKNAAIALQSINKKKNNRGSLGQKTDELIKSQAMSVLDKVADEQKQYRELGLLPNPNQNKFWPGREPAYRKRYSVFGDNYDWDKLDGLYYDDDVQQKDPKIKDPKTKGNKRERGIASNWWVDGLGALTATGNLISDALLRRKRSNSYASNPYAGNALADLASLRINPYSINKELIDQNRRNIYATNNLGGLSGAQKAYMNIANNLSMLNAIAKSNASIQEKNNAYRSAYDTAAINAGQADRVARMQANQYDLDYYSKSHAAKQQMMQMDIYNMLAALQQGYANQYKRYTFDRAMDNYVV